MEAVEACPNNPVQDSTREKYGCASTSSTPSSSGCLQGGEKVARGTSIANAGSCLEVRLGDQRLRGANGRKKLVEVSVVKDPNGRLHLNIKDEGGPGMAQASETEAGSLGMGIMEAFATQLGGSLEVGRSGGTSLTVEIKTHS